MLLSLLDDDEMMKQALELGIHEKNARMHVDIIFRKVVHHERDGVAFELCKEEHFPKWVKDLFRTRSVLTSRVSQVSESSDYVTTKLLIELQSGLEIETVILRHPKRTTICVSSQVGCKMKCTFCATGTLGQIANLTSWEILEQVFHAQRFLHSKSEPRAVTNLVFMGMGEPLNNYNAVVSVLRSLLDSKRFGFRASKVTVSTVGVIPRMRQLFQEMPQVRIALSLHAPNQTLRQLIIPTATAYPLDELMACIREYTQLKTDKTFVMIEYIMLHGVNDMPEIAHELAALLAPMSSHIKVNLIPYNPIFNAQGLAKTFVPPTEQDVLQFQEILHDKYGLFCTARKEMGQDVNGACGQLACAPKTTSKAKEVDIEDLYENRQKNKLYHEEHGRNLWKKKESYSSTSLFTAKIHSLFSLQNVSLSVCLLSGSFLLFRMWNQKRSLLYYE